MDTIYIHDLRADTVIGVFDWERRIRQTVVFDIEMAADVRRAAASDRLDDTLDYKSIAKRVKQFVAGSEFRLVETLAEGVAALVLAEYPVSWVRLKLNKRGAVRDAGDIGVIIERTA